MLAHALTLYTFDDGFDCLIAFFSLKHRFLSVFSAKSSVFSVENFACQNKDCALTTFGNT
jgi:hypothetical protein